jgi:uncharacterized protein YbjQ (UPF0145 family)
MPGSPSGGTWGSALTVGEFAAIRAAGFEPVGQVFGAAVYSSGSAGMYRCPGTSPTGGSLASFGPLVQAMYEARRVAIDRMVGQCAEAGGHGVVGVRLTHGDFRLGGLEFTAIGTAVRAPGTPAPGPASALGQGTPFTCDLSGQDFAKLVMAGWVPAGLALGISVGARHDDRDTTRQTRWTAGNVEVAGWTELVGRCRHEARHALDGDVRRFGADGVVIAAMRMRVRTRDCPACVGRHDHVAEATIVGTAIAAFSRPRHPDITTRIRV